MVLVLVQVLTGTRGTGTDFRVTRFLFMNSNNDPLVNIEPFQTVGFVIFIIKLLNGGLRQICGLINYVLTVKHIVV